MGTEGDAGIGQPAGGLLTAFWRRIAGGHRSIDLIVVCALSAALIGFAAARRDFLGDGIRHLPSVLSARPSLGEPRWLLFPPLAWLGVNAASSVGLVTDAESAIQALLWMCVASGIVFLLAIRSWLVLECTDATRRAIALLLAGSCAPVLILFSDIAEPQLAAAIAASALAYSRSCRDDPARARRGAFIAIAAIAVAALIYQGAILALGMLPLVLSTTLHARRRVLLAAAACPVIVLALLVGTQVAAGTTTRAAVASAIGGEGNPLTRSLMSRPSAAKHIVAMFAGPPQGIVALHDFSGMPALWSALRRRDAPAAQHAGLNAIRLVLGLVVVGILVTTAVRTASWCAIGALAVLMLLPVLRNQQYGYAKFFILWPIPVALLAMRCRVRTILLAATAVLIANTSLVVHDIRRGRELSAAVREEYRRATPATCWLTSGWSPPFSYLWPGTTVPILGMLATGSDPSTQSSGLTTALRHCFCESDAVWTNTSTRDADTLASLARHFDYTALDLRSVLADAGPWNHLSLPGAHVYSSPEQRRICALTSGVVGGNKGIAK